MSFNFFQEPLIMMISVLGLPVGAYISSKTSEELRDGLKYFITLTFILSFLITFLSLSKIINVHVALIIAFALILLGVFLNHEVRSNYLLFIIATGLGITAELSHVLPSLAFTYFLCDATILYHFKQKKSLKPIIIKSLLFLFVTLAIKIIMVIS